MTASGASDAVIEAIERRLDDLRQVLATHGGGVELVTISDNGAATLRMTGMCAGCPLKPVTSGATIRPALRAIDGVKEVDVEGSRLSDEAQRRLADALADSGARRVVCALEGGLVRPNPEM